VFWHRFPATFKIGSFTSYADLNVGPGVVMRLVRVAAAALIVALISLWSACGDYYRPVAYPLTPAQPNPDFPHQAVVITTNGTSNPGASTTIDVSGDTAISQATVGIMPVHAALVSSITRVFVANILDDTVSVFSPSAPTPVGTISLPSGSAPDFVASTETATVYVANSGNGTVSAISTSSNVITNTMTVGGSPVSMSELPNTQMVYVANAGVGGGAASVVSINTIDDSVNPPIVASATAPWTSPVWVASRSDSQRAYVLDKGSGFVSAIDTLVDAVVGTASVGIGADYMSYDPTLDRLYVTNPATNTVLVLDASTDALSAMTASVANPISVTALPDGTRAYVASAAVSGTSPQTVSSSLTVLNTNDLSVKTVIPLTAVPVICTTKVPSELSIAAAADSSRVYVANCDAGSTAVIQTFSDTLLLKIPAPLGAFSPPSTTPPLQKPVFVLAGP
jgi:YVTN family beta-propeller protein